MSRKYQLSIMTLITAMVMFISSVSWAESIDEQLIIDGQVMILGQDCWQEREVTLSGRGDSVLTVYSGKESGQKTNVNIDSSMTKINVYGGYNDLESADIKNNVINISGGNTNWDVYRYAEKHNDAYNQVIVSDSSGRSLTVNAIAGHGSLGEISGNKINISGGMINGYVIAAESTSAVNPNRLHDNTVNILHNAALNTAVIYGAAVYDSGNRLRNEVMGENNTLNIFVKEQKVGNIGGFNKLNYYLPENIKNGDKVLTAISQSEKTKINGAEMSAYIPGAAALYVNDKIVLLNNDKGIEDRNTLYKPRTENVSAEYFFYMGREGNENVILKINDKKIREQTKSIVESRVPALMNRGADLLAGDATAEAEAVGAQIYTPFFASTQSSMHYKTGSYVDMVSRSWALGLSRKVETEKGRLLIAPVIEYGRGSYDSYLDSGIHGRGKSQYAGIGCVLRQTGKNNLYHEGSLRFGHMWYDYLSDDLTVFGQRVHEEYNSSSRYLGAHFGVGRIKQLSEKEELDFFGKFFYGYTGKDTVRLATGETYQFGTVNSYRLRLGARYDRKIDEHNKFYVGLAYEYEFDGSASAVYQGLETPSPSLRGSSGMMEFGWLIRPEANDHLSFDLSCAGWMGKQHGITCRTGINWMF